MEVEEAGEGGIAALDESAEEEAEAETEEAEDDDENVGQRSGEVAGQLTFEYDPDVAHGRSR